MTKPDGPSMVGTCIQTDSPFYIANLPALREKLARAEHDGTRMGQVWASVRRRARASPTGFPWFMPFVALVTGEAADAESAVRTIRSYVETFDPLRYSSGLHFHFWCFAFPHARWSLYFQWLQSIGAWEPAEAARLREELIAFQFTNFFYGMRTKPDPECVDNQTFSLCFSNALIGHLFGHGADASPTAARMGQDGLRRLPLMLGGMPPSGYSGEGSTYMDHVVGPSIPFAVELLECAEGGEWFRRPLPPLGGSAEAVVRMIAREWTPGGLTLPWDHYGYSLPTRACMAWGAHRTGDPLYLNLLEKHADWSHDVGVGWGYDDLVWTLIWWPERSAAGRRKRETAGEPRRRGREAVRSFPSWCEPEVGAALVSRDESLYLMQMWDRTDPRNPTRLHCNPNAVVLCAYGSPLTVDGIPSNGCAAFEYADAWKEVAHAAFTPIRTNFGPGCAGAHSVLLVDGWESLRACSDYAQSCLIAFDEKAGDVTADVTPLYREHYPDAYGVRRRSRLIADRFWLIEDLAAFTQPHDVTARWFLRPHPVAAERGVQVETAEGVRLRLLPLLGPDASTVREIAGYPDRLDGASVCVDFRQRACRCRWLWLAWPDPTRRMTMDLAEDWQVLAEKDGPLEPAAARRALAASPTRLPFTLPAFVLADLPVARRWWYRKTVRAPADGPAWLRLPRGLMGGRLWVNDRPMDLAAHNPRLDLLAPHIALPPMREGDEVELLVRTDCGASQYGREARGGSGFCGRPALLAPLAVPPLAHAAYADGVVTVKAGRRSWQVAHAVMETP